jgi:hypothetical protein
LQLVQVFYFNPYWAFLHCQHGLSLDNWYSRATYAYSTPKELKRILDRLVTPPQGCWR